MNHKPLVSIIIPTYNRASLVENAIKTAINQTYPNKEIFVIDDGSTDNTSSILQPYKDIKYIYQKNAGQASARNNGLKHSRGTYIASLDSDDEWKADFIQKSIDFLEKESLDFVFVNWNQQTKNGKFRDYFLTDPKLKPYLYKAVDSWVIINDSELREIYIKGCPSPSSSLVIRRSSIIAGWNEEMKIADDWCLVLDIIFSKESKAAFTIEKLWVKHINCDNIYNGRNPVEVNKFLWVEDLGIIIARHNKAFTKAEQKALEKKQLKHKLISVKQNMFVSSNREENIQSLKHALKTDTLYATEVIFNLFKETVIKQVKQLKQAFKKRVLH